MTEASVYLRELAARIVQVYTTHPNARAAMLSGSAAEGLSDFYSDIDMMVYYAELPTDAELEATRTQNQGSERIWQLGSREDGAIMEAYLVQGVECQIVHVTTDGWERDMDVVLEQLEVTSPLQKALSGTLDGIPLFGEATIQRWKEKITDYPESLAIAMVKKHLQFTPIWFMQERFLARDSTLWRQQILVESVQNLLGILAGLNRLYYTTFQFKRMQPFIRKMRLAPPHLAERIEALFTAELREAIHSLETLVQETLALVNQTMPEIDTSAVQRRIGTRQQPWQPQ